MTVRTRVAPSPTGDPHVGTAYVALMNYMFAKKHGGEFILRIEDTDRARSTSASETVIFESLKWLGLTWDEGPDIGGDCGPYRQSERSDIYAEHCDKLIKDGNAFRCFCTTERLDAMRAGQRAAGQITRYDGYCVHLTEEQIQQNLDDGLSYVVRMSVPDSGTCTITDMARGEIEFPWQSIDMQILMKSDGMPTYHMANVVDDHLMGITHIMRGEEWIPSAPKHQLLYKYFGWEMPQIFHLPLLRNPDKSKLSKRKNPTGVLFYQRMGFLPTALLNFLGLSATSTPDGDVLYDLEGLTEQFDISNIPLTGPVFDKVKLDWINGKYIRENMSSSQFAQSVQQWALNETYLKSVADLAQSRISKLSDLGGLTSFLFSGTLGLTEEQLLNGKLSQEQVIYALFLASAGLDELQDWSDSSIESALRQVAVVADVKLKDMLRHFFITISGSERSLPLFQSMDLLGRDICRERLREALTTLGGVTNKKRDQWTKDWQKAKSTG